MERGNDEGDGSIKEEYYMGSYGKYLMDVNGFLLKYKSDGSIERHKDMLVGEVLHKHMELIVKKPFLLLLR